MIKNTAKLITASLADIASIQAVVREVWPIAYKEMITQEQIDYMLDMMYSDASLKKQMLEDGCEFILAKEENVVVGFAGYQKMNDCIFKLHKLYVLSSQQGKGTGKLLLDEVCSRSKSRGGISLELQVNKKNIARKFYEKNDFDVESELQLDIGEGYIMDDFVMRRIL